MFELGLVLLIMAVIVAFVALYERTKGTKYDLRSLGSSFGSGRIVESDNTTQSSECSDAGFSGGGDSGGGGGGD